MQLLIDFLPIVAFVIAYWLTDIKTAIAVIMVAMNYGPEGDPLANPGR